MNQANKTNPKEINFETMIANLPAINTPAEISIARKLFVDSCFDSHGEGISDRIINIDCKKAGHRCSPSKRNARVCMPSILELLEHQFKRIKWETPYFDIEPLVNYIGEQLEQAASGVDYIAFEPYIMYLTAKFYLADKYIDIVQGNHRLFNLLNNNYPFEYMDLDEPRHEEMQIIPDKKIDHVSTFPTFRSPFGLLEDEEPMDIEDLVQEFDEMQVVIDKPVRKRTHPVQSKLISGLTVKPKEDDIDVLINSFLEHDKEHFKNLPKPLQKVISMHVETVDKFDLFDGHKQVYKYTLMDPLVKQALSRHFFVTKEEIVQDFPELLFTAVTGKNLLKTKMTPAQLEMMTNNIDAYIKDRKIIKLERRRVQDFFDFDKITEMEKVIQNSQCSTQRIRNFLHFITTYYFCARILREGHILKWHSPARIVGNNIFFGQNTRLPLETELRNLYKYFTEHPFQSSQLTSMTSWATEEIQRVVKDRIEKAIFESWPGLIISTCTITGIVSSILALIFQTVDMYQRGTTPVSLIAFICNLISMVSQTATALGYATMFQSLPNFGDVLTNLFADVDSSSTIAEFLDNTSNITSAEFADTFTTLTSDILPTPLSQYIATTCKAELIEGYSKKDGACGYHTMLSLINSDETVQDFRKGLFDYYKEQKMDKLETFEILMEPFTAKGGLSEKGWVTNEIFELFASKYKLNIYSLG